MKSLLLPQPAYGISGAHKKEVYKEDCIYRMKITVTPTLDYPLTLHSADFA